MGCLKRSPTGETFFYPEKSEVTLTFAKSEWLAENAQQKVKRMTTSKEIRWHTGTARCIAPVCACDAPIIEMIAKPALPSFGFGDTACKRCAMHLV